ncbi:hypothetical protein C8J47_3683 [Sphingomonas sp. PP-F2F-G114-C0414]|uniref:hypothetical protein n=1 Tax=Sphingomonas sp. PP-F2F-G114-C0414 TaxID=2135662 RepID=UPI000F2AF82F|nr:hypothetical protein [Sphingomonas sp. PP-F2F-G114-C0414]RMB25734.1 hypothetical protein C8J47_3683 [Sphingomonas sp. PP-F2F-G114-C0414]
MLRALSLEEVAFVSGGMFEDADSFDDDSGGGGGDGGFDDGGSYDATESGYGANTGGQDDGSGQDIVVTAPFSKSQIDQMNQEAQDMASVEMHTINTGVALAGVAGGLGYAASAGVALGTSIVTDKSSQSIVQQKFDYIYQRDLAIQNGTARYGNGYPALQIP